MFLKFLRSCAGIAVLAVCSPAVFAQDTQRLYLSGHGKDDAVPWDFQCTSGAQSGFWTNLPVPSQWDVLGFGTLNYKKDLTNAWNEQGLYARSFPVPAAWSGQRVFLVFDGVMTDTAAQWNGQSVGPVHQGSFYRFKYEVTPFVKFGETNRLDVTVSKHSANKSVNDAERLADFWVFGGIFRPVYLEAVPAQFIERVAINARGDGEFSMDVFLDGVTAADSVEASVKDSAGKIVGETFRASIAASAKSVTLTARFNDIKPWTAETPNLYSVEVSLKQGGEIRHRMAQRFGFRTMEVRDGDGLYVNGRRVILKGANRHSFWPESGRCLSEAVHRLDIETLKDANMNAVHVVLSKAGQQFLDLCVVELGTMSSTNSRGGIITTTTRWRKLVRRCRCGM
ncbi:MAG: glycoside hydrolase family 2 TIM barrel-domain containing protein [Verrucomicrobiota bacterium]